DKTIYSQARAKSSQKIISLTLDSIQAFTMYYCRNLLIYLVLAQSNFTNLFFFQHQYTIPYIFNNFLFC
ncbi:hypothetical protein ABPG73_003578, partial [Tetrahymena malaccensis]